MSVYIFDFTLKAENLEHWEIQDNLDDLCKRYTFQKERSESGYLHYQGRVSLRTKARLNIMSRTQPWVNHCHWSVTSRAGSQNDEYVCKPDTRVEGPWEHRGVKLFIPRQLLGITLRPWQQQLVEMAHKYEERQINLVYDPVGCIGKSIVGMYMRCHKIAKLIPALNDAKDIMQCVCSMGTSPNYVVDLPRAMPKAKMREFYSALEQIKGGVVFDTRYKYKEIIMNPPNLFVFSNVLPDKTLLSRDRWNILVVVDNNLTNFLDDDLPGVDICNN